MDFTKEFDFSFVCDLTNETYIGTFKTKCFLSPLDEINVNRTYRELLGTNDTMLIPTDVTNFAFAISQLQQRIISFPAFFKNPNSKYNGGHLNPKMLFKILDECIKIQEDFIQEQKEKFEAQKKRIEERLCKIQKDEESLEEEDDGEILDEET